MFVISESSLCKIVCLFMFVLSILATQLYKLMYLYDYVKHIIFVTGNVYFTNAFDVEVYIEVMRLNGKYRKVLLRESRGQPRSIAVNPIKR